MEIFGFQFVVMTDAQIDMATRGLPVILSCGESQGGDCTAEFYQDVRNNAIYIKSVIPSNNTAKSEKEGV